MKKQYEGMFLVSLSAGEGDKALAPVNRVLERAGAEVLVCKRWDERKLAYEVAGQKRGVYVLTYFRAEGGKVADIERDVQLSDDLLRVMILQANDVTAEQMNKPTPAETGHSPQAELSGPPMDREGRPFRRREWGSKPESSPPAEQAAEA